MRETNKVFMYYTDNLWRNFYSLLNNSFTQVDPKLNLSNFSERILKDSKIFTELSELIFRLPLFTFLYLANTPIAILMDFFNGQKNHCLKTSTS